MPVTSYQWGKTLPPDYAALKAACLRDDVDQDLFHSSDDPDSMVKAKREEAAVEVCETLCPMKCYEACREYALSMKPSQMHGVMGGLTPGIRRAMIAQRNN